MKPELAIKPLTGETMRAAISEALAVQQAFLDTRDLAQWTDQRRAELARLARAAPTMRSCGRPQPPGGGAEFIYCYAEAAMAILQARDSAEVLLEADRREEAFWAAPLPGHPGHPDHEGGKKNAPQVVSLQGAQVRKKRSKSTSPDKGPL